MAISVMFKEFGIRLNFTPTVNGDRVHLKVQARSQHARLRQRRRAERLPDSGAQTRRTETELELQNGQTFAIAGPDEQHR